MTGDREAISGDFEGQATSAPEEGRTGDRLADAPLTGAEAVTAGSSASSPADRYSNLRPHTWEVWPLEREAELRRLLDEGVSRAEIAAVLGVTRNALSGKIDRLGLCGPPRARVSREARLLQRREAHARRRAKAMLVAPPLAPLSKTRPPKPMSIFSPLPYGRKNRHAGKVTIWGLLDSSCRWPLFDGGEAVDQQFYCGDEAVRGRPYCTKHMRVAWRGCA